MATPIFELPLDSPNATKRFAERLGSHLRPGDTLLLEGEIGAGKTHFARSLIQSIQTTPEDVPSPTFTIIQTYVTRLGDVIHADLYRISAPDEIHELGLLDAFGTQICLVEWPDRLGPEAPSEALTLRFRHGDKEDLRLLAMFGDQDTWTPRVEDFAHV
jgi:tRNA threonylcarbamoyladenosine biosynthesis protein TsaE